MKRIEVERFAAMTGFFFNNILPVYVTIIASLAAFTNAQETGWNVYLVGGRSGPREGIVTFHIIESTELPGSLIQTATICADQWHMEDADVVCRQLGWPGALRLTLEPYWNNDGISTTLVLHDVQCSGRETNLAYCPSYIGTKSDCPLSSWYQAGVVCSKPKQPETAQWKLPYLNVRLSGGSAPYEGIVEIFYKGEWNLVCDYLWDMTDGNVVCKQLGYMSAIQTGTSETIRSVSSHFWSIDWSSEYESRQVILDKVRCAGQEINLGYCPAIFGTKYIEEHNAGAFKSAVHICTWRDSAILQCEPPPANIPEVRLQGGKFPNQGRVEIYLNGEWGTICDDQWDMNAGNVVCHQLGYNSALELFDGASSHLEQGDKDDPIHLDDVVCKGDEESIIFCNHNDVGMNNCNHAEDVGLLCDSDHHPNYIDYDQNVAAQLGFTLMGIVIAVCVVLFICFLRRRRKARRNNTSERTPPENTVGRPASESGNAITAPPTAMLLTTSTGGPASAHAVPSAPLDLPPAYDSVVKDPSKFVFPPGTYDGGAQIPLTPPPEYAPPAVVFNADTNTVEEQWM